MTLFQFINENPGWTLLYLVVIGFILVGVAEAIGRKR